MSSIGADVERGERAPLVSKGQQRSVAYDGVKVGSSPVPDSGVFPSPSASPEPSTTYPSYFVDRFLPSIRGRPFTYGLGSNMSAGLTLSLINVPLSLSLAVASSTTPQAGILTAVWGGLAAALFGGSHYNIMGPTGALSGILARYAIMWGPECLPLLSISSGVLMMLVFLFNWDRYVLFMPSSVAHGFTLGVAAIIAGNQIGSAFSLPPIQASAEFLENMALYIEEIDQADWRAFGVFFAAWFTLFCLIKKFPRIPWMVPICLVGAFVGWLSTNEYFFRMRTLRDKYGELQLQLFSPPSFAQPKVMSHWGNLLSASVSIAFVAVLESLISGKIADGLTRSTMNARQEVFAVSAANLAAGFAGGIPATAALARTALNIRSGAQSRLAAIFNALFTLLIGLFALPIFGYLPLCIVAALLFQVAIGMVETKHLYHAFSIDRSAFWLTIIVGALCILFDPTTAIVIGAVAGLLRFAESVATGYSEVTLTRDYETGTKLDLNAFDAHIHAREQEGMVIAAWQKVVRACCGGGASEAQERMAAEAALQRERAAPVSITAGGSGAAADPYHQDTVIYRVVGDLTYLSALHHCQRLRRLDCSKHLIVSLRFCYYVDLDGLDSLEECFLDLQREGRPSGRVILLAGINSAGMVESLLRKSTWFERDFVAKGLVFENNAAAALFLRTRAQQQLEKEGLAAAAAAAAAEESKSFLPIPSVTRKVGPGGRRLSLEGDIN